MAQLRMGHRRVHERAVRSRSNFASWITQFDRDLHVAIDDFDGARSFFSVARGCSFTLRLNGIRARRQWRIDEHKSDGAGPETFHGPRAEHFLFLWDIPAGHARTNSGMGRVAHQPRRRIRCDRRSLRRSFRQRLLARESPATSGIARVERTLLSAAVGVAVVFAAALGFDSIQSTSKPTSKVKDSGQGCPLHASIGAVILFLLNREIFMFEDLKGKTAVVFGVANKRSIAWAIAQGLHSAGANLAITYQNERMEMEAKDLILSLPGTEAYMCDVSNDGEIAQLFDKLKTRYGKLHALVHSVAYAPAEELKGDFVNTTREGFRMAHDISVYSLIAVSRAAAPLMEDGGSIITMSYYGAEKVVPHYNVMGVAKAALECTVRYLAQDLGRRKIRVNAISAGPIKTLAARGISGLGDMLKSHAERAPLQRNVEVAEVGSTGVFLASDASSGITGEVIYVDCGYNIMGF